MSSTIYQTDHIVDSSRLAYAEAHAEIDSTNDRALTLCQDTSLQTPALVVAQRQSAGRGQRGRQWWSPDGALLFSLIVTPPAEISNPQQRHGLVALAAAAGLCDAVDHLLASSRESQQDSSTSARVKWPNDVLLDGRKLAGILIEAPHAPDAAAARLVVGIGLNVNNQSVDYASLAAHAGRGFDLQQALIALLQSLLPRFDQAWRGDPSLLDSLARRCALTGRNVEVTGAQGAVRGICRGIANDGGLLVETSEGLRTTHSGAVMFV